MAACASFQVQMASIMEVLTKTALFEITKLVDEASAELRLEMCRSQRENEALKSKLLVMEGELRAARGCGEGTPGSSLNIAFDVKICDEFREAQNSKVGGCLPVEKKKSVPDALDIKYEPVGGEQDWSGSVLLTEDWLEEDPKAVRKIVEETRCGSSGAAAANGGEGPLCDEEDELHMQPCPAGDPEKGLRAELKQEPEGERPDHTLPLLGSVDLGLELPLGMVLEEHGHGGSSLCEASSNASAEESHQRMEGQEEFVCTCCRKTFPDALELQTHKKQQDKGKRVGCSECGEAFTCSSVLEKHQLIHCRKEPFACSGCDKTFSQRHVLQAHKRMHTREKPHVCTDCGKHFKTQSYLKTHQRVHTREKPFVCAQCGKSFSQISNLKTHQIAKHHLTHHGGKRFSCTLCGKGFATKGSLKTHQSVHTGEKPHSCDECGKSFAYLCNLKTHQLVHTGQKPHSCDECGKRFAYIHVLKSHQSVHTGEKPHSCDKCGKSFAQLCNLRTHQSVHTQEKPHSCDKCGKSFAQLCNLRIHQRIHTGEKPHSCDECGKSFAYLHLLKSHQSAHRRETAQL